MKNIVLCSDGTGNTAVKGRGTNVWKLYEALDLGGNRRGRHVPEQVAFYDDGVGTQRFKPLKILSGAFGIGLKRNVLELYRSLCICYRPGDRIYMFGFSRGAYTVRTLAGLVTSCGIVDFDRVESMADLDRLCEEAYARFRRLFVDADDPGVEAFRRSGVVRVDATAAPEGRVKVWFVGVWDTVDAYGFPVDELAQLWNAAVYPFWFPDRLLPPQVLRGCHAIAIDDERRAFHPVLWEADTIRRPDGSTARVERAEQVWFAGVHSNVGGGYPKQGMSLVALDWMLSRAEESGLRFLPGPRAAYRDAANVNDMLYDSRAGLAAYYSYSPRSIAALCHTSGIERPRIHASVFDRIRLATDGYAPGNLPVRGVVEEATGDVAIPDVPSRIGGLVGLREILETWTSALSVTAVLSAAVVLGGWALGSGGSLFDYARQSSVPAWLTAALATALMLWFVVRGFGEQVLGRRQDSAKIRRRTVWLVGAPTAAPGLAGAGWLLYWVGTRLDALEGPWFAWGYLALLGALAGCWLSARALRRSIRRRCSDAWLGWIRHERASRRRGPAVVLVPLLLLAAAVDARAARLPIEHIGPADGLPHSRVRRIVQDDRGLIWLATVEGLVRYDGAQLRVYGPADGLNAALVNDVLAASDGSVWIATEGGGVQRLSGAPGGGAPASALGTVPVRPPDAAARAAVLLEDRRGRMWLGADDGLFVLDPSAADGAFERVAEIEAGLDVRSLAEDPDGTVWAGTSDGLLRLADGAPPTRYRVLDDTSADRARSLLFDRAGRLWVGHDSGLLVLVPESAASARGARERVLLVRDVHVPDPALPVPLPGPDDPPFRITVASMLDAHRVRRVFAGRDGVVWVASVGNGLLGIDDGRMRRYDKRHGLRDDTLNDIAEDRAGGLWLASDAAGVMRIDWDGCFSYGEAEGLGHTFVTSIREDRFGRIVVVSGNFRVNVFDGESFSWTARPLPDGVDDPYFWDEGILTRSGEWWLPTTRGLYRFPPHDDPLAVGHVEPLAVYTERDGLPSLAIGRMHEDAGGALWIATVGEGAALARWVPARDAIETFGAAEGVPAGTVTAFASSPAGDLWIAMEQGAVLRRSGERFEPVPAGPGFPEPPVRALLVDDAGRLWLGSEGGGLGRVDRPGAADPGGRVYRRADGVPSETVTSLTSDRLGRVYAGTLRGVARVDPATDRVRAFTIEDGLANDEIRAAGRDRAGNLWFGTLDGVSRLRAVTDAPPPPPPVSIGEVRVDGVARPVDELGSREVSGIELGPGPHHLEVGFFAVPFAPGSPVRYEYRLDPGDDDWIDAAGRRSVTLANLAPGRYRFEVRAYDGGSAASPAYASVAWAIAPPFWRSTWFVAVVCGAVGAAALGWHRGRVRRAVAVERLRTRIATDLHDDIGSNLTHVAILSEVARRSLADGESDAGSSLARIADVSRETIDTMSDIVWALNPQRDRVSDMIRRMRRFASDMLDARGIAVAFDAPDQGGDVRLDAETKRQVFLVFKEAVHNAARHASCTRVAIAVAVDGARLRLTIRDDGRGFAADAGADADGQGLASMRARAVALGGEFVCRSEPGRGTEIRLAVPVGSVAS